MRDRHTHTQRQRERENCRDTGRGSSRLHAGSPTWDSIPGLQDHTLGPRPKAGAKLLSHPRISDFFFNLLFPSFNEK